MAKNDDIERVQTREKNLESALRTILYTKSTIPLWIRELARTALDVACAHRNNEFTVHDEQGQCEHPPESVTGAVNEKFCRLCSTYIDSAEQGQDQNDG